MHSMIKTLTLGIGLAGCVALGLSAAVAQAGSAAPLTRVEILKVQSPSCGLEDVSDGRSQTACDHNGPNIKVYVLEVGYGREPTVTLDGFEVDGTRAPVCVDGASYVGCGNSGVTAGYLYTFDLAGRQEGTFVFTNTSINAPGNRMSAQIYIK